MGRRTEWDEGRWEDEYRRKGREEESHGMNRDGKVELREGGREQIITPWSEIARNTPT